MKYLHIETNNLAVLTSYEGQAKFPWEEIGTTARAINLDAIEGGNQLMVEGLTNYMLPIVDEPLASKFIKNCQIYGVPCEMLTEKRAIKKWEQLAIKAKDEKVTS